MSSTDVCFRLFSSFSPIPSSVITQSISAIGSTWLNPRRLNLLASSTAITLCAAAAITLLLVLSALALTFGGRALTEDEP